MQCDVSGSAPTPPRTARGGRSVRVAGKPAAHNLAKAGQPKRAPSAADQRRGWQPIPQDAWNKCAIRASSTEIASIVHFAMLRSGRKPQAIAPDAGRTSPATGIPPVFFHKGFDMKRFLIVLAVIAGFLLSACSRQDTVREEFAEDGKTVKAREFTGGSADYRAQVGGQVAIAEAQKPLVSIVAKDGQTIEMKGVAKFEVFAPAGGGAGAGIAPPQPKRSGWDRVESITKSIIGVTPSLGAVYSGIKASDNARAVSEAQYEFLGGVVHDVTAASAIVAQSGPDITVGGNLGDTQTIGGDMIGGDRTETSVGGNLGDTSIVETTIGRDQIGGDLTDNSGIIGDNNEQRYESLVRSSTITATQATTAAAKAATRRPSSRRAEHDGMDRDRNQRADHRRGRPAGMDLAALVESQRP